jgi:hypothetical protein
MPNQTFVRCFAECQCELGHRNRRHNDLIDVLNGFDKMRLAQDKVESVRIFDFNGPDFHDTLHADKRLKILWRDGCLLSF